jgi:hypothetical protein
MTILSDSDTHTLVWYCARPYLARPKEVGLKKSYIERVAHGAGTAVGGSWISHQPVGKAGCFRMTNWYPGPSIVKGSLQRLLTLDTHLEVDYLVTLKV